MGTTVNELAVSPLTRWQDRLSELEALAHSLLHSQAVQRLRNVTFLGLLSPRFRDIVSSPLWSSAEKTTVCDGSRYDHCVGVALIALDAARKLNFSERGQRYAVAWGLTHDIATWPLSHTGEPAFAAITGVSAGDLRLAIILGSDIAPERYRLAHTLRGLGIDPPTLASLFNRNGISPEDSELVLLKQLVKSPLTPDTLEGIWRCGVVWGLPVTAPENITAALTRTRHAVCLMARQFPVVLDFWKHKGEIYHRFINREDVVLWESAWTVTLQQCYSGISLADSLELEEDEMVRTAKRAGLPTVSRVVRYKEPQAYIINDALDALPPEPPVSELWQVLRRGPAGTLLE